MSMEHGCEFGKVWVWDAEVSGSLPEGYIKRKKTPPHTMVKTNPVSITYELPYPM